MTTAWLRTPSRALVVALRRPRARHVPPAKQCDMIANVLVRDTVSSRRHDLKIAMRPASGGKPAGRARSFLHSWTRARLAHGTRDGCAAEPPPRHARGAYAPPRGALGGMRARARRPIGAREHARDDLEQPIQPHHCADHVHAHGARETAATRAVRREHLGIVLAALFCDYMPVTDAPDRQSWTGRPDHPSRACRPNALVPSPDLLQPTVLISMARLCA